MFRLAVKGWIWCSALMGGGGGPMAPSWLLTRLNDRLSVSLSENKSLRFMSKRGDGRRDFCWLRKLCAFCDASLCMSAADCASASNVVLYACVGKLEDGLA